MPRSFSRNQIDKLGRRLAAGGRVTEDDAAMLARLLLDYRDALADVRDVVSDLGLSFSTRIKTLDTLTDKLRRGTRLGAVQDVAGMRIVLDGSREEQDRVVARLTEEFASRGCRTRQYDRREVPSSGYRAVHLVVVRDDCPVEIQVRTRSQHAWANAMESLADRVGRAVRYGEQPDNPTDARVVSGMLRLASELDTAERAGAPPPVLREIEQRIRELVDGAEGTVSS